MPVMTFTVDELDYAAIQREIAQRQVRSRMPDPENPGRTIPCLPEGDSDLEGAVIAEMARDLKEYRALFVARDVLKSGAIRIAADLVRSAPENCGDPLPDWSELERIGRLMRDAAVLIRGLL